MRRANEMEVKITTYAKYEKTIELSEEDLDGRTPWEWLADND